MIEVGIQLVSMYNSTMLLPVATTEGKNRMVRYVALEGKRFALGLRVTEERRKQLELAAQQSGRSISQEIELRLERSFWDEPTMGGQEMLAVFRMMASAAFLVQSRIREKQPQITWLNDARAFQAVKQAWLTIINGLDPAGPPKPRKIADHQKTSTLDELGLLDIIRQGMEHFPRPSPQPPRKTKK